jgi:hypothetical protein
MTRIGCYLQFSAGYAVGTFALTHCRRLRQRPGLQMIMFENKHLYEALQRYLVTV